jgi:hypothetical protein
MMLEPWELQIHVKDDLTCSATGLGILVTGKHFGRLGNAATVTADWTFLCASHTGSTRNRHETLWTRLRLSWSYAITFTRSLLDSPIPDLQDLSRAFGIVRVSNLRPCAYWRFRCLGHLAKLGASLETASHAIIALRIKHV